MRKRLRRERDRLKIDMQFQVHTADDDKILRSGKHYTGKDTPGSSAPTNRKITFKDKRVSETSSLPSSPVGTSTNGMDSEEGQHMSRDLYHHLDQLGLSKGKSSLDPGVIEEGAGGVDRQTKLSQTVKSPGKRNPTNRSS